MYCYSPVRTLLPLKPVRFNGTCGFSVFLNYNFVCYLHRYTVKSPVFGSQLNVVPNVIMPTTEVSNFVNAVTFASKYHQLCSKNLSPFPSLVLMLDSNPFGRLTAKNRMNIRSHPCIKAFFSGFPAHIGWRSLATARYYMRTDTMTNPTKTSDLLVDYSHASATPTAPSLDNLGASFRSSHNRNACSLAFPPHISP